MFSGSPPTMRFRTVSTQVPWRLGWLVLAPGIALIVLAVSILVWPELLAYLVASALLLFGVVLTAWGWSIMRADRRRQQSVHTEDVVHYRVL